MAQSESKGQAQEQATQPQEGAHQGGQRGVEVPARGGQMVPAQVEPDLFAWQAMTPFRRIFDDFDRLFEDMQRSVFGRGSLLLPTRPVEALLAPRGRLEGGEIAPWAPRIEIRDAGREYVIVAELPGADPKDVQIEVTDEGLVLRGEMRQEQREEEGGMWRSERRYGSFFRQIPLPRDVVDAEKAQAEFESGLLTVHLPKTEAAQQRVRRIQIVSAEPLGGGQQPAGSGEAEAAGAAPGTAGGQAGAESRRRSA